MKTYERYVDFPVEIIGHQGKLMLCTFSEAITLYEQRISDALCLETMHHQEQEIRHCENRIRQICRSYYHHFGDIGITLNAPIDTSKSPQNRQMISEEVAGVITHWVHQRDLQSRTKNLQNDSLIITHVSDLSTSLNSIATLSFQSFGLQFLITIHKSEVESQDYQRSLYRHNPLAKINLSKGDREWIIDSHRCSNKWLTLSCICDENTKVETLIKKLANSGACSPISEKMDNEKHFYHTISLAREGRDTEALAGTLLLTEERPYHLRAYYLIILLCERLRLYEELRFSLSRATALWPRNPLFYRHMCAAKIRNFEPIIHPESSSSNEAESIFQDHLEFMSRLYKDETKIRELRSHRARCKSIISVMGRKNPYNLNSLETVQYRCDLHAMNRSTEWCIRVLTIRQLGRFCTMIMMILFTILTLIDITALIALIGAMVASALSEVQWKRKINQAISGRSAWQLWLVPGLDIRRILQQESKQET